MNGLTFTIAPAIAILAILWFLLRPQSPPAKKISGPIGDFKAGYPILLHYRYFPQIRQALSEADDKYLGEAAPPQVARQARRERRAIARHFLRGLREDFSNLERLGRMIAAMSPVVNRRQETERFLLSLKFQFVWALVWLRLFTGKMPIDRIQYLTGVLGRLAARMEQAMSEINALSAQQPAGGVSV
jgi:hypothetical protein